MFDSIFSGRFKEIDIEIWFGFQKDIIFSDSVSVKSILGKERIPEYLKNNFDKRIVEIIEGDSLD